MRTTILIAILAAVLTGCSATAELPRQASLKDEMNRSIADGFFDGDTAKARANAYHMK